MEHWKPAAAKLKISNILASNLGRLKKKNSGVILKRNTNDVYYTSSFSCDDGRRRTYSYHIIIAETFLGERPSVTHTVDHINRKTKDNRILNLRWATKSQQMMNQKKPKTRQSRSVAQLDTENNVIKIWTLRDADKYYPGVGDVCTGKTKTRGGYKWRYCEPIDEDEDNHVWKELIPREGIPPISVSNHGKLKLGRGNITKGSLDKDGYLKVRLTCNDGKVCSFGAHRLVAQAFIENTDTEATMVNHRNGIKADNRVENLEWVTNTQNLRHAHENGLIKYRVKPVVQIDRETGQILKKYPSVKAAAEAVDIGASDIAKVCSGKAKSSAGYFWKFD